MFLVASACFGQTAQARIDPLIDRWLWQQYWTDKSELGPGYRPGLEFPALVFWDTRKGKSGTGFCSRELKVCQFYPAAAPRLEMEIGETEDDVTAFERFRRESLEDAPGPPVPGSLVASPFGHFDAEPLMIKLPASTPPKTIHERQKPAEAVVKGLKDKFACPAAAPRCHIHVLIPYFRADDPYVPVFAECPTCDVNQPVVFFMQWAEGGWTIAPADKESDPKAVQRMKEKIEQALMIEIK